MFPLTGKQIESYNTRKFCMPGKRIFMTMIMIMIVMITTLMPEISWDTTRLMMLMITKTMIMGDDNDDEFDVRKFHGNATGLSDAYN